MHAKIPTCGLLALTLALVASPASAGIADDIRSSFSDLGSEIATVYDKAASGTAQALHSTSALLATLTSACLQPAVLWYKYRLCDRRRSSQHSGAQSWRYC